MSIQEGNQTTPAHAARTREVALALSCASRLATSPRARAQSTIANVAESLERQTMNQTNTATGESDDDHALSELSAEDAMSFEAAQAPQRIMDGACGIGELTDRRIRAGRLRAVPWTRFSATSKTESERKGAMRRSGLVVPCPVRKVASGFVERSCVAPVIRPLGVGGQMPVSKWQTCERSSSFLL